MKKYVLLVRDYLFNQKNTNMTTRNLFVLQNIETGEYLSKISNEMDILWCLHWKNAQNFANISFFKRIFLRYNLMWKLHLKLVWKKILIFEKLNN